MKISLGAAGLLDVEPRKADHRAGGEQKREDPVPAVPVEHREIHDHRRRESEGDRIDERIELRSEARSGAGSACNTAIERVADSAEDDVQAGGVELAARGRDNGEDAEEKTRQGE